MLLKSEQKELSRFDQDQVDVVLTLKVENRPILGFFQRLITKDRDRSFLGESEKLCCRYVDKLNYLLINGLYHGLMNFVQIKIVQNDLSGDECSHQLVLHLWIFIIWGFYQLQGSHSLFRFDEAVQRFCFEVVFGQFHVITVAKYDLLVTYHKYCGVFMSLYL